MKRLAYSAHFAFFFSDARHCILDTAYSASRRENTKWARVRKPFRDQRGVTVVELLLAVSIAAIISSVLLGVSLTYYADTMRNNQTAQLAIEAHYAMRAVIEDIRLASAIATTNSLTDANQPGGGWQTSDPNNVLIIDSPAINSSRNIVYDTTTAYPYKNEYIYYISNHALRKRTLKNESATGNIAITSCPTATPTCPEDKTYSTAAGFT